MGSEILCQFLLENNEGILERQFGQKYFSYILTIRTRNQMLKLLLIYQLVELNLLYKNALFYFEKSTLFFIFQYDPHFEKSAFLM